MFGKKIPAIPVALAVFVVALLGASGLAAANGGGQGIPGAVYVMTNNSSGNAIMAFNRAANGTLAMLGTFPTGGMGFGTGADPLGSQDALVLSPDGHFLLAVNAGSNDISVLQAGHAGLSVMSKIASGGTEPVSIALYKNLVYVVNAGGTPNIYGFALDSAGMLRSIPGSSRPLAGGTSASPAQISFTPDGSYLAVTEKGTNQIDTYRVLPNGMTVGPTTSPSNGMTPFGFAFGGMGAVVVSEAFGGGAGMGAASSYRVTDTGTLKTVSASVGDTQTSPCWLVTTNNGRYAFAINAASATISLYGVQAGGALALLDATAGSTGDGSTPLDAALTASGQFLYVNDAGTGSISAFEVGSDGSLTPMAATSAGLPQNVQGIAAE